MRHTSFTGRPCTGIFGARGLKSADTLVHRKQLREKSICTWIAAMDPSIFKDLLGAALELLQVLADPLLYECDILVVERCPLKLRHGATRGRKLP